MGGCNLALCLVLLCADPQALSVSNERTSLGNSLQLPFKEMHLNGKERMFSRRR